MVWWEYAGEGGGTLGCAVGQVGVAQWYERRGREGEVDFCFPLTELTPLQQKQFISGIKDALKTAQWVHYVENARCRRPGLVR